MQITAEKFWIALTFGLIIIDQVTKLIATKLNWSIFLNYQFAFSLPVPIILMYIIYTVIILGIVYYLYQAWDRLSNMQKFAWSFVLAGGLSNIGERIALGYVRDFIPIANGMLNFADFFILFGLVLLLASSRSHNPKINSEKV